MAYGNRPVDVADPMVTNRVVDYHDRVRWGPIVSGILIALATQLVLSALGSAIGLTSLANSGAPRSNADDVGIGVGIWSIISLLIGLFVGGWVAARASGPMNRNTALLNGAILWAATLTIGSWLIANGVAGTFGIAASNLGELAARNRLNIPANTTNITAQEARAIAGNAARASWWFLFGSLLGLIASLVGATVGAHSPRNYNTTYTPNT
ncbi:hypothetical protein ACE1B6_07995 [Aerosakkonemataceae cyanobacterium BLCC-F154]|uniref:PhnA-like protein n=1 Tax=Floridaenema fluviatile BLCC-F154 TaxID=3153640 RepID=A0ABV4Y9L3_9CYAN